MQKALSVTAKSLFIRVDIYKIESCPEGFYVIGISSKFPIT